MADLITHPDLYLLLKAGTRDEIPLATPAWDIRNIQVLLDGPDVRGGDRLLPTTVGVKAYKRRATVSRRVLIMRIYGQYDRTGAANANPETGLIANIGVIRSKVSDPVTTGDGTRTGTLKIAGSSDRTATVHVISPLQLVSIGNWMVDAVLTLDLLAGTFA